MAWFRKVFARNDGVAKKAPLHDDLPKPKPTIFNLSSAIALFGGLVLLLVANNGINFSSSPLHGREEKSLSLLLVQEVGFALIVAFVIWAAWEVFKQAETEDQWNARIERVARSVFFGVLKRNFPEALIQEATELLLEKDFIRIGANHLFTLRDDKFSKDDGSHADAVIVEALVRYKVRNVANESREYPLKVGLPNPLHKHLKNRCRVRQVQLRMPGGELKNLELKDAEKEFRKELDKSENSDDTIFFDLKSVRISPGQEIEIIWNYAIPKEEEDTEVVLFTQATEAVVISVVDLGGAKRTVRAKAIHRCPLENVGSSAPKGTYSYRLDRFFLPRQGFQIWWKLDEPAALTNPQVQPRSGEKDN
jgi:hypothetical protein